VNAFKELKESAQKKISIGNWGVELSNSPNVLKLVGKEKKIFLLAGRQIVTKENLEVLAIGLEDEYKDGKPIDEVINDVKKLKSIPIIPWGFGKWTGKRKEIVEKIILQNDVNPIYLGDNGNRPWFMKASKLLVNGTVKGMLNLPGSDPLPFSREEQKPGSFGFVIEDTLNEDNPFDSFYQIITGSESNFKTFGKLESAYYFFKNQIAMQIVKRTRNK
jgi:hypothetical protein